jgi:hypothetical protein|tara:strand:+ start:160 stop:300 length:141 start_codon:yes stop_codon:yes gene_type:complete
VLVWAGGAASSASTYSGFSSSLASVFFITSDFLAFLIAGRGVYSSS